jgi:glycerate kinase
MDAAHRPCTATWWWEPDTKTAVIESARVVGLAMLPPGRFHPFELDTSGLAGLIRAAVARGAKQIIVGLGGSATNDGGFGLARALGWEFRDSAGQPIVRWTDLHQLATVKSPEERITAKIVVAVDVQNVLLGAQGATRVYGPQKGLRKEELSLAERCLRRLAAVMRQFGRDLALTPGSGAAGGLGFGFGVFLGAQLQPGFALFARHSGLMKHLRAADLVITGEGAIDRSSSMGKGTGELARLCYELEVPCIGLGGVVDMPPDRKTLFARTQALADLTTFEQACARPGYWLERSAAGVAAGLPQTSGSSG